ncbi:hypothetical protein DSCO28_73290 (plasmid) [Desulfosarcina ovata subsp. sediminis]|uniref:Uncharacterized protein n=1 Tax=Desulfosarcina ovata subsp. sediminis TaxID=885957 RepID=A0A5K8A2J1_9BACT|nr:hypothetical protein [Desulfosarcina ovata]BBO86763.1 hypothetical protein DSCO28_73290 [Desulfosarcina ovata subsp. sediminis]
MSLFDYFIFKTVMEKKEPLKNIQAEFSLIMRLGVWPILLFTIAFFSKKFQPVAFVHLFCFFIYGVFFIFRLIAVQKFPTFQQFLLIFAIPVIIYWAEINIEWYQPYKAVFFFGWIISLPTYAIISAIKAIVRRVKRRKNGEIVIEPEPQIEAPYLSDKKRIAELEKQLASLKNQVGLK